MSIKTEKEYFTGFIKVGLGSAFVVSAFLLWTTGFVFSKTVTLVDLLMPVNVMLSIAIALIFAVSGSKILSLVAVPFALFPVYSAIGVIDQSIDYQVQSGRDIYMLYGFVTAVGFLSLSLYTLHFIYKRSEFAKVKVTAKK